MTSLAPTRMTARSTGPASARATCASRRGGAGPDRGDDVDEHAAAAARGRASRPAGRPASARRVSQPRPAALESPRTASAQRRGARPPRGPRSRSRAGPSSFGSPIVTRAILASARISPTPTSAERCRAGRRRRRRERDPRAHPAGRAGRAAGGRSGAVTTGVRRGRRAPPAGRRRRRGSPWVKAAVVVVELAEPRRPSPGSAGRRCRTPRGSQRRPRTLKIASPVMSTPAGGQQERAVAGRVAGRVHDRAGRRRAAARRRRRSVAATSVRREAAAGQALQQPAPSVVEASGAGGAALAHVRGVALVRRRPAAGGRRPRAASAARVVGVRVAEQHAA